ncbi:hypothetical protein D3C80_1535320 [compost metagenome]
MQISHWRRAGDGIGRDALARTGSERSKNRIEPLHSTQRATDHQRIAALQTPDATGCTGVDEVDATGRKFRRQIDGIPVEGVAAIDDGIARLQSGGKVTSNFRRYCRRQH